MKNNMLKFPFIMALLASLTLIVSCGDDEEGTPAPPATETLLELVASTPNLDSLSKYLNRYPSLTSTLASSGTFTFFAPTNEAFVGLLETPGFPQNIDLINPDIIEGVLAYHVVSDSEVSTSEFTAGNTLNTLYTDLLSQVVQVIDFNSNGTILTGSTNNSIEVGTGNIAATNGIMHTTESVLIPPSVGATLTPILGTNAGTVLLGTDFSILAQAITLADLYAEANSLPTLVSTLAGATNHNVFAPSNLTFQGAQLDATSFTGEQWYGIIANHVVVGDVLTASDFTTGATATTAAGLTLTFVNTGTPVNVPGGPGIFIDSNGNFDPTTGAGLEAEMAIIGAAPSSNGTVHVIAGVLSPQ